MHYLIFFPLLLIWKFKKKKIKLRKSKLLALKILKLSNLKQVNQKKQWIRLVDFLNSYWRISSKRMLRRKNKRKIKKNKRKIKKLIKTMIQYEEMSRKLRILGWNRLRVSMDLLRVRMVLSRIRYKMINY